ncbi:MAG: VanZ family protein [Candidatus Hydrogenedens sp.]|nr:VanZ family protein [Candidatus Hydrogenedens sp.]
MAWLYFILTCLYCGTIAWLSGQSDPPVPSELFPHWDKVMHVSAFGLMTVLVLLGLLRSKIRYSRVALFLLPVLFTVGFGLTDEFHQSFTPGRNVDVLDIVSDTTGALLAQAWYLLSMRSERWRRFWPPPKPAPEPPDAE